MGIIIIDPPEKPKAAAALSAEDWTSVWRYCSTHTQASLKIEARKPAQCGGACVAWGVAAFVVGALASGLSIRSVTGAVNAPHTVNSINAR